MPPIEGGGTGRRRFWTPRSEILQVSWASHIPWPVRSADYRPAQASSEDKRPSFAQIAFTHQERDSARPPQSTRPPPPRQHLRPRDRPPTISADKRKQPATGDRHLICIQSAWGRSHPSQGVGTEVPNESRRQSSFRPSLSIARRDGEKSHRVSKKLKFFSSGP